MFALPMLAGLSAVHPAMAAMDRNDTVSDGNVSKLPEFVCPNTQASG